MHFDRGFGPSAPGRARRVSRGREAKCLWLNRRRRRLTTAFVCSKSESVLSVIEKMPRQRTGNLPGRRRRPAIMAGRISLDDIRQALARRQRDRRSDPRTGIWPIQAPRRQRTGCATTSSNSEVLQPVVDPSGRLTGVLIDRSTRACPGRQALHDAAMSSARCWTRSSRAWISSKGPYVKKFEEDFSSFVGVRHGVAVSNGTVALHLALVALGRRAGRRGDRAGPHLRRDHQRGALLRRHAGDRRRRSPDLVHDPRAGRARLHGADQGDHSRPSLRPAGRDRADRRVRQRPRHRRGRGLRRSAWRALRRPARSGSSATSPASPSSPTRS